MNDEYDPVLLQHFEAARHDLDDDGFRSGVMAAVNRRRRRTIATWIAVAAVALACAGWIAGPIGQLVLLFSGVLPDQLVTVEDNWLHQVFAPLKSTAVPVGFAMVLAFFGFRRILGRR